MMVPDRSGSSATLSVAWLNRPQFRVPYLSLLTYMYDKRTRSRRSELVPSTTPSKLVLSSSWLVKKPLALPGASMLIVYPPDQPGAIVAEPEIWKWLDSVVSLSPTYTFVSTPSSHQVTSLTT